MDNGNDPPARIPFLEISDEKHDSNKLWPKYVANQELFYLFTKLPRWLLASLAI